MSEKASWDDTNTKVFIDLCLSQVQKRRGETTTKSIDEEGWTEIVNNFIRETGETYDKKQLKYKFLSLQGQWQCWIRLVGETGVGWDCHKDTVSADDDWWEKKIAEGSGYLKFRDNGMQFQEELRQLFSSAVATGPNQWAPSSQKLPTFAPTHVASEDDLEGGFGDNDEGLGATTGLCADKNAFNLTSHPGGSGANTSIGKRKASCGEDKTSGDYRTTSSLRVRMRGDGTKKKASASSNMVDVLTRIADTNDREARLERMASQADDVSISGVLSHLEEVVADVGFYDQCVDLLADNPPVREASASSNMVDVLARIADTNDREARLLERMASQADDVSISRVLSHLEEVEEVVADVGFYDQCVDLLADNPPVREAYNSLKGNRKRLVAFLRRKCAKRP